MGNKLFEDAVKKTKDAIPEFDENNPEHLDAMTKAFILSNYENKQMRESYLSMVIEESYRRKVNKLIKESILPREKEIDAESKILELEKEIVERKMKVLREFMN